MRLKAILPKAGEVSGALRGAGSRVWRRIRAPSGQLQGRSGREKVGSRPISRVLSRTAIHLGCASPRTSSDLPGSRAGHTLPILDGSAGFPIWSCSGWGLPCRGVLPPARCALTAPFHPCRRPLLRETGAWAVCFLWHFPWAHAPQALPGIPPCGARTFLCDPVAAAAVWPTPGGHYISRRFRRCGEMVRACPWQMLPRPSVRRPARRGRRRPGQRSPTTNDSQ